MTAPVGECAVVSLLASQLTLYYINHAFACMPTMWYPYPLPRSAECGLRFGGAVDVYAHRSTLSDLHCDHVSSAIQVRVVLRPSSTPCSFRFPSGADEERSEQHNLHHKHPPSSLSLATVVKGKVRGRWCFLSFAPKDQGVASGEMP